MYEEVITGTITGNLPRKSNSRRLFRNRRTGAPIFVKSKNALEYSESFLLQAPRKKFIPDHHPIKLTAIIYYQSRRSDLSAELLCDLIEKAGIIENDRLIFKKDIEKRIDPKNPRVIFRLEKFVENTGADNDNL